MTNSNWLLIYFIFSIKFNDTIAKFQKKKNVYILCLFTKQINNFLSNNTTMPSVHYLLKIKIKENVSNRDYIHIYIYPDISQLRNKLFLLR